MRMATFVLAGLQVVLLIVLAVTGTGGSDAAGNAMSGGVITLVGIVMGILLAPALILAINRRYEKAALTLAILSLGLMFVVLRLV